MHAMQIPLQDDRSEVATTAARLVVEEGLEYGPAKRRAVKLLGMPARMALPANDAIDDAVTEPGCVDVMWLDGCPLFAPIRNSARFQGLRELAERQARIVLTKLDETRESE